MKTSLNGLTLKKLFQLFPSILCYFCPVCYSPAVSAPLVLLQGAKLRSITKTPEAALRLESAHIHTDPALRTAPRPADRTGRDGVNLTLQFCKCRKYLWEARSHWSASGSELELISEISAVRLQHHPTCEMDVFTCLCLLLVAQRSSGPWAEHTAEDILCSWWLLMPHYRHALKLHNVTSREFSLSAADCTIIVLTVKNWDANTSLCWLLYCITWVYFLSVEERTPSVPVSTWASLLHMQKAVCQMSRKPNALHLWYFVGEQNPGDFAMRPLQQKSCLFDKFN